MNKIIYYVSITLLTVVSSCGNKETNVSRKLTLDNCPVIAQVINLQGDPVTNLDFSSVKDTFNLPLSSLLSSFQVIRLENSEDAPYRQHNSHRDNRTANASHNAGTAMRKCKQTIKQRDGMNLVYTKCHYFRFVIKCGNQGWCKQIHRNSDTLCKQRAANQTKLNA